MIKVLRLYQNNINVYREIRQQAINEINYLTGDLENIIRSNNNHALTDVSFGELQKFEIDEKVELTKGIYTTLKEVYNGKLVFDVVMEKGSTLGLHTHSDCAEDIVINRGGLLCLSRRKSYDDTQIICYNVGEQHNLIAISDLELTVIFTKQ